MNETNEHNPDGLTPEQYGAPEWRLLKPGERLRLGDDFWSTCREWLPIMEEDIKMQKRYKGFTFRRRVSPTLAEQAQRRAEGSIDAIADQSARIVELERENKNLTIALETIGKNYSGVQQSRNDYAINFRRANAELSQLRTEVERLKTQLAEREEDRALLDWLIDFVQQNGADGIRNMIWTMDPDEDDIERADLLFDRAAIRAARAQEDGK